MYERARKSLTGGVSSSYQVRDPWPIYLEKGHGSRVWDVDGNEMVDFHNGFGSMVQGHAHPAIVEAVQRQVARGTHFAAPVEDAIVVSEELVRRFGLPQWRYVNSGSEATMDAIRIARAFTGRDTIVKIFGSYHGHHDYVMVSISRPVREHRRPRQLRLAPLRRRNPQSRLRPDHRGAVQRRRGDGAPHRASLRRGPAAGLRHHGAGDDESGRGAAGAGVSRGGARDHEDATAWC